MVNPEKKEDVWRFSAVLGGGVLFACLLSAFFLWIGSSSGSYLAGNVLLRPDLLEKIRIEKRGKSGDKHVYEISSIQYAYYYPKMNSYAFIEIPYEAYKSFYHLVANLKSLPEKEVNIQTFSSGYSQLKFYLQEVGAGENAPKVDFFEVQFAKDLDSFRVQLLESGQQVRWAYFQKEGLSSILSEVFIEQRDL